MSEYCANQFVYCIFGAHCLESSAFVVGNKFEMFNKDLSQMFVHTTLSVSANLAGSGVIAWLKRLYLLGLFLNVCTLKVESPTRRLSLKFRNQLAPLSQSEASVFHHSRLNGTVQID